MTYRAQKGICHRSLNL